MPPSLAQVLTDSVQQHSVSPVSCITCTKHTLWRQWVSCISCTKDTLWRQFSVTRLDTTCNALAVSSVQAAAVELASAVWLAPVSAAPFRLLVCCRLTMPAEAHICMVGSSLAVLSTAALAATPKSASAGQYDLLTGKSTKICNDHGTIGREV